MIFLAGEVGPEMYLKVTERLMSDWPSPVNIFLNSEGGDVLSALAIYDRIVLEPQSVITATGECSSSAVIILQAAKIRRATPHTQFYVHLCYTEHKTPPTPEEKRESDRLKVRLDQVINKVLGYKIQSKNITRALSLKVFDAKTALALGFIDEIWEGK